jgi:hypothetical protein
LPLYDVLSGLKSGPFDFCGIVRRDKAKNMTPLLLEAAAGHVKFTNGESLKTAFSGDVVTIYAYLSVGSDRHGSRLMAHYALKSEICTELWKAQYRRNRTADIGRFFPLTIVAFRSYSLRQKHRQ